MLTVLPARGDIVAGPRRGPMATATSWLTLSPELMFRRVCSLWARFRRFVGHNLHTRRYESR
ncbi:hypothetical protein I553_3577 [Mycobacterium xenopi 4042]|uniref:Uncharacterized protein n=1 Tax=Mycobacterium xenopi 4042 TaxID=1299334 RepID=X8AVA7_MYCXE|nr:hypothetical protein I553_3577 [Mycobacterium xenopi 4042]